MSMIVWILLGLGLGLIASKVVSTTGEGTVVDILLGIVGALLGGWLFDVFGGSGVGGFNTGSIYSAVAAMLGAIALLASYHAFLRRRML
ncbi:MAG TPA: GlsB/YeaQ/YmgE family stress response membrane protein [Alphaproteobacteria bacterium]|nr:GlsB/YeaQ/YmgE family stress response membrane protein [Alphaproteobacteria bacterium]